MPMTPAYRFKPLAYLALGVTIGAGATVAWHSAAENSTPAAPAHFTNRSVPVQSPADPGMQEPDDGLADVDRAWQVRDREVAAIKAPPGVKVRREWNVE
jgi:hypothetical protein